MNASVSNMTFCELSKAFLQAFQQCIFSILHKAICLNYEFHLLLVFPHDPITINRQGYLWFMAIF